MTSKELNIKLISLLPEMKAYYNNTVSWQDGDETGSHVVFEDAFVPYIKECAKKQDESGVVKCFEVIEKLLVLNDEYAEEVIALSVLESLLFSETLNVGSLYPYMYQETKKMFDEVREGWSRFMS